MNKLSENYNSNILSEKKFFWLFVIGPIAYLVMYFQLIYFNAIAIPFLTYNYILVGIIIYYNYNNFNLPLVLCVVYLSLIVLFIGNLNDMQSKFTSSLRYVVTIASFIYFASSQTRMITAKKVSKMMSVFSILYIVIYYLSVFLFPIMGKASIKFSATGSIMYLEGFFSVHNFAFTMASFALYFYVIDKKKYSIISAIAGLFTGTRTGLLLNGMLLILINKEYLFSKYNRFRNISILLISLIITSIIVIYEPNNPITNTYERFFSADYTADKSFSDLDKYSSGRTKLWEIAFIELKNSLNSTEIIFGHGPLASLLVNEKKIGIPLWFHNDFVEIVFAYGILGILLYLGTAYYFLSNANNKFLFLYFFLIAANFNGFYQYMNIPVLLSLRIMEDGHLGNRLSLK